MPVRRSTIQSIIDTKVVDIDRQQVGFIFIGLANRREKLLLAL